MRYLALGFIVVATLSPVIVNMFATPRRPR